VGGVRVWSEWSGPTSSAGMSSLSGKTIAFLGDSIVEQGDYPERIGNMNGATIHKFGFGGCRAGRYTSSPDGYDKQCLYNIAKCINTNDYSSLIAGAEWTRDNKNDDNTPQANAMANLDWSKVDILVIAFGTNDWTGNPVGTELVADPNGMTFKGAMCYSVEEIQLKYPHIQIVLIGMSYRLRTTTSGASDNSDDIATSNGYLKEYQQAILDVAERYHVPAFDMYSNSGVNRYNYTYYLRDGIHPKAIEGNKHWAMKISSFLNSSL
ncbi:SGNH/GDSL hydrolase family protein, partial [Acinetobacter rudis]